MYVGFGGGSGLIFLLESVSQFLEGFGFGLFPELQMSFQGIPKGSMVKNIGQKNHFKKDRVPKCPSKQLHISNHFSFVGHI